MTRNCPSIALAVAVIALGLSGVRVARAQNASASVRWKPFRVTASFDQGNLPLFGFGASGSAFGVSYDFKRLGTPSERSGDPATLSVFLETTGDNNPFSDSEGTSKMLGVSVRTQATPLYAVFGIGISRLHEYDTISYDSSGHEHDNYYPLGIGYKLFVGLDMPHTPIFLEAGARFRSDTFAPGASVQVGIRL